MGVAAHITAAAPGGPRYEPLLSNVGRASSENGIWLCQNCAKLVDNDPARYPVDLLQRWKRTAEANALENIGRQRPFDRENAPRITVATAPESYSAHSPAQEISDPEVVAGVKAALHQLGREFDEFHLLDRGAEADDRPYAIVGLTSNHGWDWDVILFVAGNAKWNFIARITLPGQKGHIPTVRNILGNPGALVLKHVAGYGTGVFRESCSWYRLSGADPVPLLTYPIRFYVVGWGMPFDRRLMAREEAVPSRLREGAILKLRFTIEYSIADSCADGSHDLALFTEDHAIELEWNELAGRFVPHTAADDPAIIDELWNEATDGWVSRHEPLLRELSENGTFTRRRFVKTHILPHMRPAAPPQG